LGNVDRIELKTFLERFEFDFLYFRVNIQKSAIPICLFILFIVYTHIFNWLINDLMNYA